MSEPSPIDTRALSGFVAESNRIEGIHGRATPAELAAHVALLAVTTPTVELLEAFVDVVAGAKLRRRQGMNVRVGGHRPPPGGPGMARVLGNLLVAVERRYVSPYEAHVSYELLHPFMDGNGRSGRALWAWHMRAIGQDPFALGFLHRFYYQTLDAARRPSKESP